MRSRTALKPHEKGTGSIYKVKNRFYLKHRINGKSKAMMLRNADGSPCTTIREAEKAAGGMRKILLAETKCVSCCCSAAGPDAEDRMAA